MINRKYWKICRERLSCAHSRIYNSNSWLSHCIIYFFIFTLFIHSFFLFSPFFFFIFIWWTLNKIDVGRSNRRSCSVLYARRCVCSRYLRSPYRVSASFVFFFSLHRYSHSLFLLLYTAYTVVKSTGYACITNESWCMPSII